MLPELVVQWTLMRSPDLLRKIYRQKGSIIAEQFSDPEYGRVDFIYKTSDGETLITELETAINSTAKFNYCRDQTIEYKKMIERYFNRNAKVCIMYDSENTTPDFKTKLEEHANSEGMPLFTYKLSDIETLYEKETDRLLKTLGVLPPTPTSDMPYTLSSINRFLAAFRLSSKKKMTHKEISETLLTTKGKNKGRPWSKTSVVAHAKLCSDVGAIEKEKDAASNYVLTDKGQKLIAGIETMNMDLQTEIKSSSDIPLSSRQRHIIIDHFLTENQASKTKSMIFYFLRYIDITHGDKIPNQRNYPFTPGETELANRILGTAHNNKTNLGNILTWSRNYCEELGLIEIVPISGQNYSKAVFTSLGSRFYGILETQNRIKRESVQIQQEII